MWDRPKLVLDTKQTVACVVWNIDSLSLTPECSNSCGNNPLLRVEKRRPWNDTIGNWRQLCTDLLTVAAHRVCYRVVTSLTPSLERLVNINQVKERMLTGRASRLAHRPRRLGRNEHKSWRDVGKCMWQTCCLCSVSVYPPCRRCHTGWGKGSRMNIPERAEKRLMSGGCVFRENLQLVPLISAVLTSQRSQCSDWSPSSHGHWAQVLEQC